MSVRMLRMPLAIGLGCLVGLTAGCGSPEGPNVILITLDTTRYDHLSCYDYERKTSPNIDALAAESAVFEHAYAVSSWTLPTHASIFTGRYPKSHGARYDPGGSVKVAPAVHQGDGVASPDKEVSVRMLAPTTGTLALHLKRRGYQNFGAVAGPWMKGIFGLNLGFDQYDESDIHALYGRAGESVSEAALGFLENKKPGPFLLFLNYYDAHQPWGAPGDARFHFVDKKAVDSIEKMSDTAIDTLVKDIRRSADHELLVGLYDGEIRYMDAQVGRVFDDLKRRGLWEESWVIVTADHGEMLGEKGVYNHGVDSLSEGEIHIPLIIKPPKSGSKTGISVGRRADFVQQVDLLPLLLSELGIDIPRDVHGVLPGRRKKPIVAELRPSNATQGLLQAIVHDKDKLLWRERGVELYDIVLDPSELVNLQDQRPEDAELLARRLKKILADYPEPLASELGPDVDEETLEALRGLGYVGDD